MTTNGRKCSVEGCPRAYRARGYCSTHYAYGKAHDWVIVEPPTKPTQCSVEGCTDPHKALGLCALHHMRQWRTGDVGPASKRTATQGCAVNGCTRPHCGRGFCGLHRRRSVQHGDPLVKLAAAGERSARWTGNDASYFAVHQRLREVRGPASRRSCCHCQARASQWAYDHSDPAQRESEIGPYSVDLDRYLPLCASCHKRFDLTIRGIDVSEPRDIEPMSLTDIEPIREMMEAVISRGGTARALAESVGMHPVYLSRLRRHQKRISRTNAERLTRACALWLEGHMVDGGRTEVPRHAQSAAGA